MTVDPSALVVPGTILPTDARVGPFAVVGCPGDQGDRGPVRLGSGAVLRAHAVLYAGNHIGARFHLGDQARLREDNDIGDDVSIGAGSVVEHHVTIGDGVRLHTGVFVPEHTVIEAGAWIGPRVVLTNSRYPAGPRSKEELEAPVLGRGCRIGANVTILPGVRIGAGALVGAGSVVTKDVPDGALHRGVPAVAAGLVEDLDAYR